jgi:pimeloyl-ACP methyl ester carboxylesterase
MPNASTDDGVQLYYEVYGEGSPILFIHEFGGSWWSWEPQISYFARRHQCITYAARGYPPSSVPTDLESYSMARAVLDALAVLDDAKIERAHFVGLSMGGFTALHAGLDYPDRVLSIVAAGAGYGAEKQYEDYFKNISLEVARNFEERGSKEFAPIYAEGASRVQFQAKDPLGWRLFAERLAQHDPLGAANTMRGVQARRPSLYDLEERFRAMDVPSLIISGDEDDHCLQPGIFLKRTIPRSGLAVLPKTGHTVNFEEPQLFNSLLANFLAQVEANSWGPRDPRANPDHIMRTD